MEKHKQHEETKMQSSFSTTTTATLRTKTNYANEETAISSLMRWATPTRHRNELLGIQHQGLCRVPPIAAMGINLFGCETLSKVEPQARAQVQRSTTLIPTTKGMAEQRTTRTKVGRARTHKRKA